MSVTAFREVLHRLGDRLPQVRSLMIMGTDGIPIERLTPVPVENLEAIAAEYTTLLRSSVSAADDTGLGALRELVVVSDGMTAVLRAINPEYFLFACLSPDEILGRARHALRVAALTLESEFD